ncbi:MAG: flagellar hook-basal body complex protein FliE [Bdellovibrionales bacterium]|nr:flagellar hook-basal body complex protein FliE [Bdellovibrionales bacterium]
MAGLNSIEGLNQLIPVDPSPMGGGLGPAGGVASDALARREMDLNGLEAPDAGVSGKGFLKMLSESVMDVNQDQASADYAIQELLAGRTKNIHETMLAVERADASLKMMMQVRNKLLEAYREVMRMQV